MDDDLVLNLVDSGAGPSVRKSDGKGIRWTERYVVVSFIVQRTESKTE